MALDAAGNDFLIKKGRYLVDGFDIENTANKKFSEQADRDPTTLKAPAGATARTDSVYLEVWIAEISSSGADADPDLGNLKDVNMLTCLRHKLKWVVRVAEGKEMPASEQFVHRSLLATIGRKGAVISAGEITDKRSKLRTFLPGDGGHLRVNGPLDVTGGLFVEDGNVGIGTTEPKAKLHVVNIPEDAPQGKIEGGSLFLGSGESYLKLGYHGKYSWIQSYSSKPLAINPLGNNVGIGTTAPGARLHVAGDLKVDSGAAVTGSLTAKNGLNVSGGALTVAAGALTANGALNANAGAAIKGDMTVTGKAIITANVGIGTAAPGASLHVAGDQENGTGAIIQGKRTVIHHGEIDNIKDDDAEAPGLRLASKNGIGGLIYGGDANHSIFLGAERGGEKNVTEYHELNAHRFFTGGSLNEQKERLRINADGKVGIGTADPQRPSCMWQGT